MRSLLLLATLTACTSDRGLVVHNAAPDATITAPGSGDEVLEGREVELVGQVSDDDDATAELVATFQVGGTSLCGDLAPDGEGVVRCTATFAPGEVGVVLIARDPDDAIGTDRVDLVVQATAAPEVALAAPTAGGRYYANVPVDLSGTVDDLEDGPSGLDVEVVSDRDGPLDAGLDVAMDGGFTGRVDLSAGVHELAVVATDTDGKEGRAAVRLTVRPDNTPPTCTITSPVDGGAGEVGSSVTFAATVSDPDVPANELAVRWESDLDGVLLDSFAGADGVTALTRSNLSEGTHRVTLTVTDDAATTCTRTVSWTLGEPPSLTVVAPGDGAVVNEGAVVAFEAEVSDTDSAETELRVTWTSDLDGELARVTPDSSGAAGFSTDVLRVGDHTLTVRVTDPDGLYREARRLLTVNGLPSAPTVEVGPAEPTTTEALRATITADSVDPDGDPVTYTYTWYQDGVVSSASTSATVPASATAKGETWRVVVTPSDGVGTGPGGEDEVEVVNTPPSLASASLSPASPATGDDLTCIPAGTSDADGDSVSVSYAWAVDGVGVSTTTATLAASAFARDETVTCTATPFDGEDTGTAVTASVTIANTAPTITGASITPASPTVSDTLTCASVGFTDADGDSEASTYAWEIEGASAGTGATLSTGYARGDTVTCEVTPSDGTDDGTPASTSVTVANALPSIASVSISPSTADTTDTLTCSYTGFTDADGDSDASTIAWSIGSTPVGTGATLAAGTADKGETVTCTVTPRDGTGAGTPVAATRTLVNAPPTVTTVAITPSTLRTDDTAAVSSVTSDPDGDSVSITAWAWTVDGASAGTSSTLDGASAFDKGEEVQVTITVSDGTDTATGTAAKVTVANSAPTAPTVSFTPSEWYYDSDETTETALVCAGSGATDADSDSLTTTYAWTVDGTSVSPSTSDRLTESDFSAESEVQCTVTVSDGTATASSSATLDIFADPVDNGWVQFPCTTTVSKGSSVTVYGRVFEDGITNVGSGPTFGAIDVDLGVGPDGTDPATSGSWTWTPATGNSGFSNGFDYEYQATYTVPSSATSGSYDMAFRFSTDGGLSWRYGDRRFGTGFCGGSGTPYGGSDDGYSASDAAELTVP